MQQVNPAPAAQQIEAQDYTDTGDFSPVITAKPAGAPAGEPEGAVAARLAAERAARIAAVRGQVIEAEIVQSTAAPKTPSQTRTDPADLRVPESDADMDALVAAMQARR